MHGTLTVFRGEAECLHAVSRGSHLSCTRSAGESAWRDGQAPIRGFSLRCPGAARTGRASRLAGSPARIPRLTRASAAAGNAPAAGKPPTGKPPAGVAAAVAAAALGHEPDLSNLQQRLTEKLPDPELWQPPPVLWRSLAAFLMAGQVMMRILQGKVHLPNTQEQLGIVGPGSVGVAMLTAGFVGMAFTINFVREFTRLGLTRSVGGVLALALSRELTPVVTAIILAGRIGSAFAAELGTMQVTEQTETLRVLRTDPVDYLITPRVLACALALPVLTLICFTVGLAASVFLADMVYGVSANVILDSAVKALRAWDLIGMTAKAFVFGLIIALVSCSWGITTTGGAKGVGESTTSAVVISLCCIFMADFVLSYLFFQGPSDALKSVL